MMDSSVVSKLLGIFEATAGRADGVPLVEISAEVGLAKPTAHRILKQLVATGFMERCGPGVYRQTPQSWRLVSLDGDRRLTRAADKPLRRVLHNNSRPKSSRQWRRSTRLTVRA